jgi:acyl carrier protein phosphodiesterase
MSARNKARKMIDAQVQAIAGIGLDDLPDTCLVSEYVDTLEEMIEEADSMTPMSELLDYAQEAAMEFLEEEGMSA